MARDSLMRELGGLVLGQVRDALNKRATTQPLSVAEQDEPPVVAQLMVEIRSDGSRTIARGALNDLQTGETAQLHAEGRSPRDLMLSLASSLLSLPATFFRSDWMQGNGANKALKSRVAAPTGGSRDDDA